MIFRQNCQQWVDKFNPRCNIKHSYFQDHVFLYLKLTYVEFFSACSIFVLSLFDLSQPAPPHTGNMKQFPPWLIVLSAQYGWCGQQYYQAILTHHPVTILLDQDSIKQVSICFWVWFGGQDLNIFNTWFFRLIMNLKWKQIYNNLRNIIKIILHYHLQI